MADTQEFLSACRRFGEARLAICEQAKSMEDWKRLWKPPAHPFSFRWGSCWTFCIEYSVNDFAAEVGFFLDILGLDSNALGTEFAMLMSPNKEFYFAVKPAGEKPSTPPDAIRLQFMLEDLPAVTTELESRGIVFAVRPAPCEPDSPMYTGHFHTPNGIPIDLWGMVAPTED